MSANDDLQLPVQSLLGNLFRSSSADRRRARRLRARSLTRSTSSSVSTQCDLLATRLGSESLLATLLRVTASLSHRFPRFLLVENLIIPSDRWVSHYAPHVFRYAYFLRSPLGGHPSRSIGVSACTADFPPISSTSLLDLGNQRCFSPRLFREVANSNLSSPLPDGAIAYIHSWPPSPNSRKKKSG